jgi:hypothetical protein
MGMEYRDYNALYKLIWDIRCDSNQSTFFRFLHYFLVIVRFPVIVSLMSFTPIDLKDCKFGTLYVEQDMGMICLVLATEDAKTNGDEVSCMMRVIGDFDREGKIVPRAGGPKNIRFTYSTKISFFAPKMYIYEG